MAMLDEIGTALTTAGVATSSGSTGTGYLLVKSMLPDSTVLQNRIVALIETPGEIGEVRPDLDRPGLQVLVRGDSITQTTTAYEEARQKAEDVKSELHGLTPGSLSGRHYPGIWALQDPFLLTYDGQDRPVLTTSYRVLRSRT